MVTFTGICRGDENGEPIAALTLEHYPGMAEAEIARHVEEAQRALAAPRRHRHPPLRTHRAGRADRLVVTASSHRQAAFAAAEFLMDYLKTRAPFWKQVEKTSGAAAEKTLVEKTWVEAKSADDDAAERWAPPPPSRAAAK